MNNILGSTYLKNVGLLFLGFILRFVLLKSSYISNILGSRVEISTPLTSWKRAIEGVSLWKQGINPYDGDIFHESPLGLIVYENIITYAEHWIPAIFPLCDVLTSIFLFWTAKIYLNVSIKREANTSKCPETATKLLLKPEDLKLVPFYVAAVFLMCPYSILSCGGKSTVTFQNTILSLFILLTVSGQWFFAAVILALLSCHSFYHTALLVPLLMYIHQERNPLKNKFFHNVKLCFTVVVFCTTICALIYSFHNITGSWHFLGCTYGSILSVPDLTPNIGLFWYFFTEMFEHFRVFFLWIFQLNVFIYTIPLCICLRKEPIFFLFIHLIIITIFKSYPCIGDVAFYFALLPIWCHLFRFMHHKFIVCCILASCTLLAPTLWHLWIYSGSANANFYFSITLAFNTGQVFLLTDILSACIKREYYLENGIKRNEDGTLILLKFN